MKWNEKYDRVLYGIVSGLLLPLFTGLIIYLFTAKGKTIGEYLTRINSANIVTHAITLCVFTNIIIFLIYNRFDMLKAARGVLAVTIVWAVAVFIIKFI
jgi:hypothetical protein